MRLDLSDSPAPLGETLAEFLCGPPDEVSSDSTHVVLSGCRAHACIEKAWVWIDATEDKAVAALVHYTFNGDKAVNGCYLLLFSNDYPARDIPAIAKRALSAWLANQRESIGPVLQTRYIGPDKSIRPIVIQHFHP